MNYEFINKVKDSNFIKNIGENSELISKVFAKALILNFSSNNMFIVLGACLVDLVNNQEETKQLFSTISSSNKSIKEKIDIILKDPNHREMLSVLIASACVLIIGNNYFFLLMYILNLNLMTSNNNENLLVKFISDTKYLLPSLILANFHTFNSIISLSKSVIDVALNFLPILFAYKLSEHNHNHNSKPAA